MEIYHPNDPWATPRREFLISLLEGKKVLEVGCGTGYITLELAGRGYEVTGVDNDKKALDILMRNSKYRGVKVINGDFLGARLPGAFDAILLPDVLEHIQDDSAVLRKCWELLKDGGVVVIAVPVHPFLFGARDRATGHVRRYTRNGLLKLVHEAGFRVEKVKCWNLVGIIPKLLIDRLLNRDLFFLQKERYGKVSSTLLRRWMGLETRLPIPIGVSLILKARKCP